jgi:hypothetical protein
VEDELFKEAKTAVYVVGWIGEWEQAYNIEWNEARYRLIPKPDG